MKNNYVFRDEDLSDLIKYRNIEINQCIACGSIEFRDFSGSTHFPARRCNDCGLIWMNPSFNEDGLNRYYSDYIMKRRLNNEKKMVQRQEQYKLDVSFVQRYKFGGRMLDVGCNGGFYLDCFSDDFDKYGIDIDMSAIEFANQNYNELTGKVYCIALEDFEPDLEFDLITMRGVIEHVTDPEKYIEKVSGLLKKGGMFAITATPNADAVSVELYLDDWTLFHPIQHLWHFSPRTLELICNRHDLVLIAKDFPYIGTPYEDVYNDIKRVADRIDNNTKGKSNGSISPAFFENMMSLVFKKK